LGYTAVFPVLCTGGSLHVLGLEQAADPAALAEYFRRHAIDCLKITPSHLRALLASAPPAHLLPRRRLILGGEACGGEMVEQIRRAAPECIIINHYGPTETTVGALTHQVNDAEERRTATPPLGRPLANSRVYILDSHLRPVPPWVAGEVYIGGAGLARG